MEFLEEILNGWRSLILKQTCSLKLQVCLSMYDLQSLTIFAKISTVDTWQGSEHTSETLVNLKYYEMRCILPESGVKNALNPKNSTKLKMTSSTAVVTSMLDCFEVIIFLLFLRLIFDASFPSVSYSLGTGHKLNVQGTFRRPPGYLPNVLFTFT